MANALPLKGIRVIDFSQIYAGPYCAMILGLFGAQVIKVESQRRLELTRKGVVIAGDPHVGRFTGGHDLNINKLAITLDLTRPRAVALAKKLVAISDVVVANFTPGQTAKLGIDYLSLQAANPDIIMVEASGAGGEGPESRYRAFAPAFNALSGLSSITGYKDGPPSEIRGGGDLRVGTVMAYSVLAALFWRKRGGRGQYIDLSSREAISCLIGDVFMDYIMNQRLHTREGNRDDFMAPHNCYPCQEEGTWVSIAIGTDEEWASFCGVLGSPPWTRDAKYSDQLSRWYNQDEMDVLVGEWTRQRTNREVTRVLQKAGVAAMPSFSNKDLFEDPHLRERGYYTAVEHPELGRQVVIGPAWKLERTPGAVSLAAPLVGQHNAYVFHELLGMSTEEIAQLVKDGVIY